ncbi:MAG: TIGR01777 family oxidoreductase, partial [Solirubrobacteraceae bacterium]
AAALAGADAVINLLGEPIAQRWNDAARARIRDSRVLGTRMLHRGLRALAAADRPRTLLSGSATGYYGPADDRECDEEAPAGRDYLAEVVLAWEAEALAAQDLLRVALTRTGLVLSPTGGALAKMLPFFRAGIGGPVAGGRHYMPWVHIDDVVAALLFCIDHVEVQGPLNLTAPNPVMNAELSRELAAALHRPAVLPVPALALRVLYGQMAEIVTTGQRAVPRRLLDHGFAFAWPALEPALRDVLSRRR